MWSMEDVQKTLSNIDKLPTLKLGVKTDGNRSTYEIKQAFRRFFVSEAFNQRYCYQG